MFTKRRLVKCIMSIHTRVHFAVVQKKVRLLYVLRETISKMAT